MRVVLWIIPALLLIACQERNTKSGMQQAADMLCQASKVGLDPPESAYRKYAKQMNTTPEALKKHAKGVVGSQAFADYILANVKKLPDRAQKRFAQLWSAVAGVDPKQKLELLQEGFKEHGVKLDCKSAVQFLLKN